MCEWGFDHIGSVIEHFSLTHGTYSQCISNGKLRNAPKRSLRSRMLLAFILVFYKKYTRRPNLFVMEHNSNDLLAWPGLFERNHNRLSQTWNNWSILSYQAAEDESLFIFIEIALFIMGKFADWPKPFSSGVAPFYEPWFVRPATDWTCLKMLITL